MESHVFHGASREQRVACRVTLEGSLTAIPGGGSILMEPATFRVDASQNGYCLQ